MSSREALGKLTGEELDGLVHDLKGQEAASVNNAGKDTQLNFLLGEDPKAAELADILREITGSLEDDHQTCLWCEDEEWTGPGHRSGCPLGRAKTLLARMEEGEHETLQGL